MRCGQVAGVGGAEWTHKVMNAILSAKRHRTHWDRVEDYMYIKINGDMLDKVSTYDYEEKVIAWTEGVEVNEGWADAAEEVAEEFQTTVRRRADTGGRRSEEIRRRRQQAAVWKKSLFC